PLSALALASLLWTLPATFILLSRLLKGAFRHPPLAPRESTTEYSGTVSIVIPTLNEVQRLSPCLQGLSQQGGEVREILVVDSNSRDGTRELVKNVQASETSPKPLLLTDPTLPPDWVGRPWALDYGFRQSSPESEWVLGLDADTQPQPGLVASLVEIACRENYDLISLSPQFILHYPGEWWLQPALLMTLLYRFNPSGSDASSADRVMANGQCFFCRRSVLTAVGGYERAKASFCDDVTLARFIAARGYKVGFLEGREVLKVRMYEGAKETWQEWGRSLDLKDASSLGQIWGDVWLLSAVQGFPLPVLLGLDSAWLWGDRTLVITLAIALNLFLVLLRWLMLMAIAPSYAGVSKTLASWLFWLSPLADILAVSRIFLSSLQKPKQWRGRVY
ncbi:2'-O-glycosyltransferase CruG, partial [Spirulina sp. 06S082]|uniref:2'-O-glycosyltransferase CruG n=1 Tax=Spirulina sp. 06S082 TaxID=3110248 RepID=UPI002B1F60E8